MPYDGIDQDSDGGSDYDQDGDGAPAVAGSKNANDWGLHDVHGNVWEWVRVGTWASEPRELRPANREAHYPGYAIGDLGLRLARSRQCRTGAASQSDEDTEMRTGTGNRRW